MSYTRPPPKHIQLDCKSRWGSGNDLPFTALPFGWNWGIPKETSLFSSSRGQALVENLRIWGKITLQSSKYQNRACSKHPTARTCSTLSFMPPISELPCPAFFQNTYSFHWTGTSFVIINHWKWTRIATERQTGWKPSIYDTAGVLAMRGSPRMILLVWAGWENA